MSFTNIDLTNMMRGEGEWKNMQEIVRRTLKICFEQMDKQSEQIASLVGQVGSLKSQLSNKVNRDEVDLIIKAHMKTINSTNAVAPSKTHVTKAEYDKLKEQLIQVRNDIERKASIRYVDECMHRKIDRSDLLVKNLQTFSAAQYSSQLTQLFQDLTDTKAQVDSISRATSDMQKDMQGAQDLHVVKNQMEAIYRSMSDYYTKNHINALLDQKVRLILQLLITCTLHLCCTLSCICICSITGILPHYNYIFSSSKMWQAWTPSYLKKWKHPHFKRYTIKSIVYSFITILRI